MNTIVEFLEARIAEDETAAQRVQAELQREVDGHYRDIVDERGPMTTDRLLSAQLWAQYDGQTRTRNFAKGQYLARMAAPSRILAECAAKRAIIEGWEDPSSYWLGAPDVDSGHILATDAAVRALAAVYASHPNYQQEWAL